MPHAHIEGTDTDSDFTPDAAAQSADLAEKLNAQNDVIAAIYGVCDDSTMMQFVTSELADHFSGRWHDPVFRARFAEDREGTIATLAAEYRNRIAH